MIALDSYAWFEYFFDSPKGKKVKELVDSKQEIILTPALVLYEVKNKLIREGKPFETSITFILERSVTEPLSGEAALLAVDLRPRYKLKTSDAFIYATALHKKVKLLTGDQHFKNLPEVKYLE